MPIDADREPLSTEDLLQKEKDFSDWLRKENERLREELFEKYVAPVSEGDWFGNWPDDNGEYHWLETWSCGCCVNRHGFMIVDDYDEEFKDEYTGSFVVFENSKGIKKAAYFEAPILPTIVDNMVIINAFRKWVEPSRVLTGDDRPHKADGLACVRVSKDYSPTVTMPLSHFQKITNHEKQDS